MRCFIKRKLACLISCTWKIISWRLFLFITQSLIPPLSLLVIVSLLLWYVPCLIGLLYVTFVIFCLPNQGLSKGLAIYRPNLLAAWFVNKVLIGTQLCSFFQYYLVVAYIKMAELLHRLYAHKAKNIYFWTLYRKYFSIPGLCSWGHFQYLICY